MSLMLGSRIRFIFPSPLSEFFAAANLLLEFVCYLHVMTCLRDFACHVCVAD